MPAATILRVSGSKFASPAPRLQHYPELSIFCCNNEVKTVETAAQAVRLVIHIGEHIFFSFPACNIFYHYLFLFHFVECAGRQGIDEEVAGFLRLSEKCNLEFNNCKLNTLK